MKTKIKERLLVGTILSAVALALPFHVVAGDRDAVIVAQNAPPSPDTPNAEKERREQRQRPGGKEQQGQQPGTQQQGQQPGKPPRPAAQQQQQQQQQQQPPGAQPPAAPQRPTVQQPPAQPPHPTVQHPPAQPPHPTAQQQPPAAPQQPPAAQQQPPAGQQQGQPPRPTVQQPHPPGAPPPTAQQPPPHPSVQQAQPPAPTALPPPAARQQPGESHPTTQASPPVGQQPGQPPRPTAQQPTPPTSPPIAQQPVQQQQQAPAAQQQPQSPAAQQQQQAPAAQQQQPGQPSRPVAGPQPQGTPQQNQLAAPTPPDRARRIDEVRGERREVTQGDRTVIEEPGRMIIREAGRAIIRHNEIDRFRAQSRDVRVERRGGDTVTVIERPDGTRIVSVVDEDGRLIRRSRQGRDGREIVIIDNRYRGPATFGSYYVELPPPVIRIPRERYIVEADRVPPTEIYAALRALPVERIDRRYTLEEIRYSPMVRDRMPRIDLDTVTFESGSWEIAPDQTNRLAPIAEGIRQAVAQNPSEVFLIEGHTDAVGADVDNLSLSDRRAESVAVVLSEQYQVPGENLTTQGYGEQYLKVPTDAPERLNRRVTVRRITPLLTGQNQAGN